MLKTLHEAAKSPRTALTQAPLGEFAVLGALLLGLQYGYSSVERSTDTLDSASLVPSQTAIDANEKLNDLIDKINDSSWNTHSIATTISVPATGIAPPLTVQTTFENAQIATPEKFQFTASTSPAWINAKKATPFLIDQTKALATATWQMNSTFSFSAANDQTASKDKLNEQQKFVIMLDPGHGGSDPGSIGHNGLQEKALTLDIAKRAERILSKNKDISVILTRDDDTGMSRKNRVQKVKRSNADMVVSLHLNHLPQTDVNLVETFYAAPRNILESIEMQRSEKNKAGMVKANAAHNPDLSFTQGSKRLASLMQRRVFEEVIDSNPNTDNAGVKEDTLYILTRSFTPGVLIELSCLSNIQEAERLNDVAYRERLAKALAKGINEYLDTPAAKRDFGPEV